MPDPQARSEELKRRLAEDKTISDVTRGELQSELDRIQGGIVSRDFFSDKNKSARGLSELEASFATARAGTEDKFRSRQAFQRRKSLIADRPGQRQLRGTVLSRSNPTAPTADPKKKKTLLSEGLATTPGLGK